MITENWVRWSQNRDDGLWEPRLQKISSRPNLLIVRILHPQSPPFTFSVYLWCVALCFLHVSKYSDLDFISSFPLVDLLSSTNDTVSALQRFYHKEKEKNSLTTQVSCLLLIDSSSLLLIHASFIILHSCFLVSSNIYTTSPY